MCPVACFNGSGRGGQRQGTALAMVSLAGLWVAGRSVADTPSHQHHQQGHAQARLLDTRDMLIWQIDEFLYPTSILSIIYHIRADTFRIFGL